MQDAPYALVPLLGKNGDVRAQAMVSPHRLEWALQWTWRLGGHGYACRGEWNGGHYRTIYLHREIAGAKAGDRTEVDHHTPGKHGTADKLDCRDETLRLLTPGENRQNTPGKPGNARRTSKYRGVDFNQNRWRARVRHAGKSYMLGRFDSEEEAAAVAAAARRRLLPYSTD